MKPRIDSTAFGSITVAGGRLDHDILIRLSGAVEKRKKKLSKAVYGTSHVISLDEAKFVYEEGAEGLVLGTGQYGAVRLSDEAQGFFEEKGCHVLALPTPDAVRDWNRLKGARIGLFHVAC